MKKIWRGCSHFGGSLTYRSLHICMLQMWTNTKPKVGHIFGANVSSHAMECLIHVSYDIVDMVDADSDSHAIVQSTTHCT